MKTRKVFLSYNWDDKEKVIPIVNRLRQNGIDAVIDQYFIEPGEEWRKHLSNSIMYQIHTTDTVILCISKNYLKSKWSKAEMRDTLKEYELRKISIIPILIDDVEVPEPIKKYRNINLHNTKTGFDSLLRLLYNIPNIEFKSFDGYKFEQLVEDLLKEYKFFDLQNSKEDYGYDIRAKYKNKNPFGQFEVQTWLVQIKLYKENRFSINAIKQIIESSRNRIPQDLNILLITNSVITSVAKKYLEESKKIDNLRITVIDGILLENLIANKKKLLDKYFGYVSS